MKVIEYISLDQLLDLFKTKQMPSSEVVKIINKRSDFLEDLKGRTLIFKQLEKHDVSRRLYHVINNVENVDACECGKEKHFDSLGKGYDNVCQDKVCINRYRALRVKNGFMKKYGVDNPLKIESVRKKHEDTCMERYGVKYPMQSETIQMTRRENCVEKYGVDHHMKDAVMFSRSVKGMSQHKEFVFPSGRTVMVRGYEHFALKILLETFHEDDLVVDNKEIESFIGKIFYFSKDFKKHRYYGDIYIKSLNKIIEVKSTWTYNMDLDDNLLKKEATEKMNVLFEFMLLDKNGNTIKINN